MVELAIRVDGVTHYFDPQSEYDRIYNFLTERLDWSHEAAEDVASWAEVAYFEDEYDTGNPDVEIFFVMR